MAACGVAMHVVARQSALFGAAPCVTVGVACNPDVQLIAQQWPSVRGDLAGDVCGNIGRKLWGGSNVRQFVWQFVWPFVWPFVWHCV